MFETVRRIKPGVLVALAVSFLAMPTPVLSVLSFGCMEEAIDGDPLFHDWWHGGAGDEPDNCGFWIDGECEWIETGINAGEYGNFHSFWDTGRLSSHNHGEAFPEGDEDACPEGDGFPD